MKKKRLKNKLIRINLNRSLNCVNKNKYFLKKIFIGLKLRISFYGYGWLNQIVYGICLKTYNTKNFHSKILIFNRHQKLYFIFDLMQNIYKSVKIYKF